MTSGLTPYLAPAWGALAKKKFMTELLFWAKTAEMGMEFSTKDANPLEGDMAMMEYVVRHKSRVPRFNSPSMS